MPKTTTTIYIPRRLQDEQILQRLQRMAILRERSVSELVVEAIEAYLDRQGA